MTEEVRRAVLEVAAGTETIRLPESAAGKPGENLRPVEQAAVSKGGSGRGFQWVIPFLLAGVVGLGLTLYYKYEQSVNREVTALQQQAKKEALAGRYSEAVQLLERAEEKRPRFAALTRDRELASKAAQLKSQLDGASTQLKAKKLDEGEKVLKQVADMIGKRQEPLFEPLQKSLAADQVMLTVLRIKGQLDRLTTVDALADKLDTVSDLSGQEAAAVKAQIINKIAGISYSSAEEKLRKKDFTGALKAVDNGLSYAADNPKLTSYRKQISEAKQEFEEAEAKRIQLAQQKAAEEDLNNRTAAVDVSGVTAVLDDYGDLAISGMVTNNATRPIYSVSVDLNIYGSSSGAYIGDVYANISPFRLEPGESGSFSTSYYGVYEQAKVSVDNASWYLE
ncbi:FxLYD domain-containing protein [Paenibacillus sp. XY044]|uniref:FxLYD domain-containing protein n=1 Tax=Paenibacillus sp. XY044 TaxID=2026089 RepID=UPI000B980939|nr:FxLYD domain-containing protein [Paenibacillus sp. XY044]OZB90128.1 hypothetical protein CJP46_35180 [Paenibacillus sp. XY044]